MSDHAPLCYATGSQYSSEDEPTSISKGVREQVGQASQIVQQLTLEPRSISDVYNELLGVRQQTMHATPTTTPTLDAKLKGFTAQADLKGVEVEVLNYDMESRQFQGLLENKGKVANVDRINLDFTSGFKDL